MSNLIPNNNSDIDSCIKFCENFNVETNLEVNVVEPINEICLNEFRFMGCEKIVETCKPKTIKFNTLCEFCWYYKNYTYFECKHFQLRGIVSKYLNPPLPSKKCMVCNHLGNKSCPLIIEDPFLLKRLFKSFNIRLHIPVDDSHTPPSIKSGSEMLLREKND